MRRASRRPKSSLRAGGAAGSATRTAERELSRASPHVSVAFHDGRAESPLSCSDFLQTLGLEEMGKNIPGLSELINLLRELEEPRELLDEAVGSAARSRVLAAINAVKQQ